MNAHVEPRFAGALNAMFAPGAPLIAPGTPPDEAARVAADLAYLSDREILEARKLDRAIEAQQRCLAAQGMLE